MNKVRYKNSFRELVHNYIERFPKNVILRSDLNQLGNPRQISRAIKNLIDDGLIVKFGYGIYVKAEISEYINQPIPIIGFTDASIEAMNRLGIKWEIGTSTKNYNEGKSTQIPAKFIVRLKSRYRGTIGYDGINVVFEEKKYAR